MKPIRRARTAAAIVCVASLHGVAWADGDQPAPDLLADPEATVVDELVVRATLPGPAWWKIQRGEAVVYVLGLPDEPPPRGLVWDQSVLQRRLASANALILPVTASAGLGDLPALLRLRGQLKSRTPMEDGLPAPLRARFAAARAGLGQPAARYSGWGPLFAGQKLVDDFHQSARVDPGEPVAALKAAARRLKVPARPAGAYRAVAVLSPAISNLTPEINQRCLGDALDEVDGGAEALRAAGEAWVKGDVQGVLAGPRGFARCQLLLSGGLAFWRGIIGQDV